MSFFCSFQSLPKLGIFPSLDGSGVLFWHIHHAARSLADLFIVKHSWVLNKEQMSSQAYFHLPLATKSVTFSKSSLWQQLFTQSTHLGQTRGSCPQRAFSGGLSTGASLFTCSSFCFPWQCSEQGTCPFSSNISSALLSTLPSVFSSRYPSPVTLHPFIYVTFIVSLSITRSCIIYLFVQLPCCNEHTQETETLGFGLCFCCCLWLRAQNSAWHIIGTWMEDGWMDGWTDGWVGGQTDG